MQACHWFVQTKSLSKWKIRTGSRSWRYSGGFVRSVYLRIATGLDESHGENIHGNQSCCGKFRNKANPFLNSCMINCLTASVMIRWVRLLWSTKPANVKSWVFNSFVRGFSVVIINVEDVGKPLRVSIALSCAANDVPVPAVARNVAH